jgi:putative mRNA 3-end processing factor
MIGSSQARVEYQGRVWVVSGDYKTGNDGISGAFEPVRCQVFVTESTFGLPIYHWKQQEEIYTSIRNWVEENKRMGKTSVLIAYSLGKAQRLLKCLEPSGTTVFAHGAIANVQEAMAGVGIVLPPVVRVTPETPKGAATGQVVIAPPGAEDSPWIGRFQSPAIGICSGWMQVRGNARRRNADAGFALSDHADWPGLLEAVKATGAEKIFVTHGFQAALSRYLNEVGIAAAEVKTEYGEDDGAGAASAEEGAGDGGE